MTKLKIVVLLTICLSASLLGGCAMRQEAKAASSEETVSSDTAADNTFSGRAEAAETVNVVSKQSGKVSEVLVDIGSKVEKGATLFQLDSRDLSANIDVARASLDSAQVAYETALDNQKRAQVLEENGAIGYAEYENNYLNVLERSEAAVNLAQANLNKAQIAYNDSIVTAPISGTVTDLNIDAGEMASSQSTSIVLVNLDEIMIKLYVSEKKINALEVGQSYKVEFSAIPDKSFDGKINSISDSMDNASKGYLVNVTVANPDHLIKDGMFAKVNL